MTINNSVTKNLVKSTSIVLGISLFGSFGGFLFGFSFFGIFFVLLSIQYIIFYTISYIAKLTLIEKTKQKQLEKLESLSTILNCSYCNKQNIMTFTPDDNARMEFKCDHCDKTNLVTLQFVVARLTEPVKIPTVTGIPLQEQ